MRRFPIFIAIFGVIAVAAVAVRTTAQFAPSDGSGGDGSGGPPHRGGHGGLGGGFHLIPPFAVEKLNLTKDQQKQVADLEKETKAKLYKILTPKQQKILETAHPSRPRHGGQGGGWHGHGGGQGGSGGDQGGSGGDKPPPSSTR